METSGNTALITGGGSGIGLELAKALLARGNRVIVCGRSRKRLEAARKLLPDLHARVCDVTVARSRRALVKWLVSEFKDLNILVNNAGIQRPIDFLKGPRDLEDADMEIKTNFAAPVHLSGLLIPHLRRRKQAAIVNISSGLAFTPLAAVPVYCATKAAFHSFSLTLRHQLLDTSVRVFEIAPPIVATGLAGKRSRPRESENVMSAEEVAAGVIEAMKNDRYEVALGAAANLHKKREDLFSVMNG